MTVATQDRQPQAIGASSGADDDRRPVQASSGLPVTTKPARAVRKITNGELDDLVDRALVAVMLGFDVGVASAIDGRVEIKQPKRSDGYLAALSDATVLAAGRVLHPGSCRSADVEECEAIANRACRTQSEAESFLSLCCERAASMATSPRFWDAHRAMRQKLIDCGGTWNVNFRAPRDSSPLVHVEPPAITINMAPAAPPIVNVEPTPITVENNVELTQPDKVVSFSRNYEGEIIEATTSSVGAA